MKRNEKKKVEKRFKITKANNFNFIGAILLCFPAQYDRETSLRRSRKINIHLPASEIETEIMSKHENKLW